MFLFIIVELYNFNKEVQNKYLYALKKINIVRMVQFFIIL
jgi:hypothetical protein